ncbi:MAG: hypothetical protein B1H04_01660 [Planctomycetales bacterium 4484_123]|nr:MAG: hypothetical protein B1H04_01660 [Planctomycetales bacterium 4484_123]
MGRAHLGSLAELAGQARLVAAADVVEQRARDAAQAAGAELAVGDYRQLLDHVDAVLVALLHHLHHAVGVECLAAGKHVLMEKPLAVTDA